MNNISIPLVNIPKQHSNTFHVHIKFVIIKTSTRPLKTIYHIAGNVGIGNIHVL